jgi:two-component system, sensor histidine kinase and response regulator
MRILVAEDSPDSREILLALLRKGGHSVTGVCDGREALNAINHDRFEIVFLDEEMPGMSGIETAHAIRRKGVTQGKQPIIIGVSGHTAEADERRFLDAGMDGFLPKPVGMTELLGLLAVLARRPSATRFAQAASSAHDESSPDLATHLRRATGGNEALLRPLLKNFLQDFPKKLSAVQRAVAERDAAALASAAHGLIGSLGLFGAQHAVAAARRLQAIGRSGSVDGADQEFRAIEAEFLRLKRDVLSLRRSAESGRRRPAPKPRSRRAKRRS